MQRKWCNSLSNPIYVNGAQITGGVTALVKIFIDICDDGDGGK